MADWSDATALVVVDVQEGFNDPSWGPRNNAGAEENIRSLISAWRDQGWPLVYVRHDSTEALSKLNPDHTGNAFQEVVSGEPDLLVVKSVHSAFYGEPDLHEWLQGNGISSVAICGIQTNVCCETTARMAGDLGYDLLFIIDAMYTFDIAPHDGQAIRARELSRATELMINAEFGQTLYTSELLGETVS